MRFFILFIGICLAACEGTGAEPVQFDGEFIITSSGDKIAVCKLFPSVCDDDNDCTQDLCTTNGCAHAATSSAAPCYEPGGFGTCVSGYCCVGYVVAGACYPCDDNNPCTYDQTDSVNGGCSYAPLTHGDTCTINGQVGSCVAGVCTP